MGDTPQPAITRQIAALELAAGASLGALVGILLGLSSTGTVGTVVSALAAALAAFLGLAPLPGKMPAWRILGFGAACSLAVLLAVAVRAHDWLGVPLTAQVQAWRDAGATPAQAVGYAAYQRLGVVPSGQTIATTPAPSVLGSNLFASHDPSECAQLLKSRFDNSEARLAAMKNLGGTWANFAASVAGTPPATLGAALDAGYQLVCGAD